MNLFLREKPTTPSWNCWTACSIRESCWSGDITITVADIELIYLRLQLMLSSAETARQAGWLAVGPHFDKPQSVSCAG